MQPREPGEHWSQHSDLILFDLKLIDAEAHQQFTGVGNERILDNLDWLGGWLTDHPAVRLWIRTPLIPGATLTEENITGIGAWLAEHLPGRVERWELCAFNNLCRDKYTRLGLEWAVCRHPAALPVRAGSGRRVGAAIRL